MTARSVRNRVAGVVISALALGVCARAQDARSESSARQPGASGGVRATVRPAAKGPLPDPVLLDGSTQPAEKRPEHGMLGDFELPGDDNVREGKVGGPQQQMPPGAAGGQQMGLPQMSGGGAQAQQMPQGQMPPQGAQAAAGGGPPPAGEQPQQPGGGGPAGPADPNAQAAGMQVGELQTDPNAGAGGMEGSEAQKPGQVAIGDKAMQIKGVANAPGVIGAQAQVSQNTQQMEKAVGGGKGASSVQGGRNASEKGRAMPAGL